MLISFKIQNDFNLHYDYYYINAESFNEYYVNMWICWCSIALFHIYIYDLLWFVVRYIYDFYPTSCDIKSSGEGIQSVEYRISPKVEYSRYRKINPMGDIHRIWG